MDLTSENKKQPLIVISPPKAPHDIWAVTQRQIKVEDSLPLWAREPQDGVQYLGSLISLASKDPEKYLAANMQASSGANEQKY